MKNKTKNSIKKIPEIVSLCTALYIKTVLLPPQLGQSQTVFTVPGAGGIKRVNTRVAPNIRSSDHPVPK